MIYTVLYCYTHKGTIYASPKVSNYAAALSIADEYRAKGMIVVSVGANEQELKRLGLWINRRS